MRVKMFPSKLIEIGLPHSLHRRRTTRLDVKEKKRVVRRSEHSELTDFTFTTTFARVVSGVRGGRIGRQSPIGIAVKIQGKAGYAFQGCTAGVARSSRSAHVHSRNRRSFDRGARWRNHRSSREHRFFHPFQVRLSIILYNSEDAFVKITKRLFLFSF